MKRRHVQETLLTVLLLAAPAASAQEAAVASPGTGEASPPVASAAPPAVAAAVAEPTAPTALDERLTAVETKLSGTEETVGAMQASVDGLKKLKIGGFVQSRYEYHQDAMDGWDNYKNQNRFYVRHAYLGAKYEGKNAEYFLQIDANNNDGVALKDAEATFVDTWTPFNFRLTIGQFKLPFGYEILQSDADREMPERAAVITGIFPGDRDRGLRLQGSYGVFRLKLALVNGASFGQKDPSDYRGVVQNGYDPNGFKTVVGRLGADLGWLSGGLSGMWGRTLDIKWPDPTKSNPGSMYYYQQLRLGADAQGYIDVPGVGGLALKGEVIWARKTNRDYEFWGPADSCLDRTSLGWMVTAVQNIGPYLGVAVRLDQYDPFLSGSLDARCNDRKDAANRDKDRVTRLGGALLLHGSANVKLTLSYEHPWEQATAVSNDIVTAQLQTRF
jgi:hypothetical protein